MGKRYFLTNIKESPGPFGLPLRECDLPPLPDGARTTQVIGAAAWGLCIVTLPDDNFRPVINHAGVDTLPDVPLNIRMDAIGNQGRNLLLNAFTRRGLATDIVGAADDYAAVIRHIGRRHDPNFDEQAV